MTEDHGSVGIPATQEPSPSLASGAYKPSGVLSDVTVMLGGYPVRVVVKRTSWDGAAASLPIYIAMGREERCWALVGKSSISRLIAALQEAIKLAPEPEEGSRRAGFLTGSIPSDATEPKASEHCLREAERLEGRS